LVKAKARALLSKNLVLNSYLHDLFGVDDFKELQEWLEDTEENEEGFDEEGRSYIFKKLLDKKEQLKIPLDKLEDYDSNIYGYLQHINKKREKPITLKYFQYLSILFTEIYLDSYFSDPTGFLSELNNFAISFRKGKYLFSRNDLRKLAFWMATGSGKTIVMHINFLQIQKYNRGPHSIDFDNVLLITPSETMSEQHMDEMEISGIPYEYYDTNVQGYFSINKGVHIRVLDIHKLVEEKSGSGVTVDIEEFGNKNLIFVDEGHKGSGGDKWRSFRDYVAQEGFTFEYSATFGQAIASVSKKRRNALLEEYGKSILFDYSYRYFHKDGYGKDYRIFNLKNDVYEDHRDILLLANALSFYEQKLLYDGKTDVYEDYNIEDPLWVFVGSRVKGEYGGKKKRKSDVLNVLKFLDRFLLNEDNWVVENIKNILDGNSSLLDDQDRDLFSKSYPEKKLSYLRKHSNMDASEIYSDMLSRIFHISASAPLHVVNFKGFDGEIGLRAGSSNNYFAVINIGDDREFLKYAKKNEFDHLDHDIDFSLFKKINKENSTINILIGAKKFIEGWNCWRVSNMGLLNVGKKGGTQIIQLFGRGVRLRGKDRSLKRSKALPGEHPDFIRILETLNIFGIKANYMETFKEHLENEGIDVETYQEFSIDIEVEDEFLDKELSVPKFEINEFENSKFIRLTGEEDVNINVDLNPRVETLTSLEKGSIKDLKKRTLQSIDDDILELLDWDSIYFRLLEFRSQKGWYNISFSKNVLKEIMRKDFYTLYCPNELVEPPSFSKISFTEDVVVSLLEKYVRDVYTHHRRLWAQDNVKIENLNRDHDNLDFEEFSLKVKHSEKFVLSEIKNIVEQKLDELREKEFTRNHLSNVYFDRHIYQPLLSESSRVVIQPAPLNEGERMFLEDLKNYYKNNKSVFDGKEIFVLRNLPKRGVGFYENTQFFPDFMIWVKSDNSEEKLIFVDPHGLSHMFEGLKHEKVTLWKRLGEIEDNINRKYPDSEITLDSFIVSVSPYNKVRSIFDNKPRKKLEDNHILFQKDDSDYISKIFNFLSNN